MKKENLYVSTVLDNFIIVVVEGSIVAVNITANIDFTNRKSNYNYNYFSNIFVNCKKH